MRQVVRERAVDARLRPRRPDEDRHGGQRARPQHDRATAAAATSSSRARTTASRAGACGSTFVDQGPGIADIELAMKDGYTTGSGLGLGLGGARRLVERIRDRVDARARHARRDHRAGSDDRARLAARRGTQPASRRRGARPVALAAPRSASIDDDVADRARPRRHRDRRPIWSSTRTGGEMLLRRARSGRHRSASR